MKYAILIVVVTALMVCCKAKSGGKEASAPPSVAKEAIVPGRYLAFSSKASDLVPLDTNEAEDVFVHDRIAGKTARVSVSSKGTQGNGDSSAPSISADGRLVVFQSAAKNLTDQSVSGVFLHDRSTMETRLVSIDEKGAVISDGSPRGPSISKDGQCVVFSCNAGIMVHDLGAGQSSLASINDAGEPADKSSDSCSISADGRYVAFRSYANNLLPPGIVVGPSSYNADIYVRDRAEGKTLYVSVAADGGRGGQWSHGPVISADGRWVAFWSYAQNLVSGDVNGPHGDVFVRDLLEEKTVRISIPGEGIDERDKYSNHPSISENGRYVAFVGGALDQPSTGYVWVKDFLSGETSQVEIDIKGSLVGLPFLSLDGRFLAVESIGPVGEEDTNDRRDILLHDRETGDTRCITLAADGEWLHKWGVYEPAGVLPRRAPALSSDGRFMAFLSGAEGGDPSGVQDVFLYDRQSQETTLISSGANGHSWSPAISADGNVIAFVSDASNLFEGDQNESPDIFAYALDTGELSRVTVPFDPDKDASFRGSAWDPVLSKTGRYVAFASARNNFWGGDTNGCVDVYVRDLQEGLTSRVSVSSDGNQVGYGDSWSPAISADGRFVAFVSTSPNLVPESGDANGKADIFVHDREAEANRTKRVSIAENGAQANGDSWAPSMSGDGGLVVFSSWADNLVSGDENGRVDVFLRGGEETICLSRNMSGAPANGHSWSPVISSDGRFVTFVSEATDLVPDDTNSLADVFLLDRQSGQISRIPSAEEADVRLPSLSADGRFVAYLGVIGNGDAPGAVGGTKNVLWDRLAGMGTWFVGSNIERTANDHSWTPRIP